VAKGKARGRPRNQGKRTASGRISRAGKTVKGSIGTRLAHARPLLGQGDAIKLAMLCCSTPAQLLASGEILPSNYPAPDFAAAGGYIVLLPDETPAEAVDREREALFVKAEATANAVERRDPIGRAWHEGLLDGQGVDAEVLRDLGRNFGWLYWHEYRAVDATIGGYSDMVALGSVRLGAGARDTLGTLFKAYGAILDGMGRNVRAALDRLCVDDMWFSEGPDWLDRLIRTRRLARDPKTVIVGELARKDDERTMELALRALVALARGGASTGVRYSADRPLQAEAGSGGVYADEAPEMALDAEFMDDRGYMRPWEEIREIVLQRIAEGHGTKPDDDALTARD
jgi:hypothetical protein